MGHVNRVISAIAIVGALVIGQLPARAQDASSQPTSAPLSTDSAGRSGRFAVTSVFRVICPDQGTYGTGFLHKSGMIITAAHVIDGCTKIIIGLPDNTNVGGIVTKADDKLDLAIVKPATPLSGMPLIIADGGNLEIGQQVAIWGFPAGYIGRLPMLSAGYVAGVDAIKAKTGDVVDQMVLNAAVNHGNSGGPVVLIETGEVIGVADNKIVPLSPTALSAISALQSQPSGFTYTAKLADGTTKQFSEGQVVAMVLEELRQQVQLVVGRAVFAGDVRQFLQSNGIAP